MPLELTLGIEVDACLTANGPGPFGSASDPEK